MSHPAPGRAAAFVLLLTAAGPAGAQPQPLPAEQLARIKAATVYIKAEFTLGREVDPSTGSGFVVRADAGTAWVVTNDHVVSPPARPGTGTPATTLEVVFRSGTADEWSGKPDVAARDPDRDLALLRVRSKKPLPDPLPLGGPGTVTETAPVYVCGFPFGAMLAAGRRNPEVSVGLATVSSLRANDRGDVVTLQLDGALNPGNSGGPVVAPDGRLVGVAVRTVRGAGIGEAVPQAAVAEMFRGRLGEPLLDQKKEWLSDRYARVGVRRVDPLGRIKDIRGFLAPADGKAGKAGKADPNVAKLPRAVPLALTPDPQDAGQLYSDVDLPAGAAKVWIQVGWTDTDGKDHLGPPVERAVRTAGDFDARPGRFAFGPGGIPLPPLLTRIPPTPPGQVPIDTLNDHADRYLDQRVTVDVLVHRATPGKGNGPALDVRTAAAADPDRVHFVVTDRMADHVRTTVAAGPAVARIRGTVRRSNVSDRWRLVVVSEMGILAESGAEATRISLSNSPSSVPGRLPGDPGEDTGLPWVKGPDGRDLPVLATKYRATPPGQIELTALNERVLTCWNCPHTVDAVVTRMDPSGCGDGPSLVVEMPGGGPPRNIDFVVSEETARRFKSLKLPGAVLARLSGRTARPPGVRPWALFHVEGIGLVARDGTEALVFGGNWQPKPPSRDHVPIADGVTADLAEVTRDPERNIGRLYRMRLRVTGTVHTWNRDDPLWLPVRGFVFRELDRLPIGGAKVRMWTTPKLGGAFEGAVHKLHRDRWAGTETEVQFKVMRYDRPRDEVSCCITRLQLFDMDGVKIVWEEAGPFEDHSPEGEAKARQAMGSLAAGPGEPAGASAAEWVVANSPWVGLFAGAGLVAALAVGRAVRRPGRKPPPAAGLATHPEGE